ncbi:hypothetical protein O59_004093 [Cellvibrio sp. BR]|nr:hypothetical protein O59_004093 [Cellvibrio sp. BR]
MVTASEGVTAESSTPVTELKLKLLGIVSGRGIEEALLLLEAMLLTPTELLIPALLVPAVLLLDREAVVLSPPPPPPPQATSAVKPRSKTVRENTRCSVAIVMIVMIPLR